MLLGYEHHLPPPTARCTASYCCSPTLCALCDPWGLTLEGWRFAAAAAVPEVRPACRAAGASLEAELPVSGAC